MSARREPVILGSARMRSPLFSNLWVLTADGDELARLRRFPREHLSRGELADGTGITLAPLGWGTVRATSSEGDELGRIDRRSWWGRRWEITAPGFQVELMSRTLPRRWAMTVGGEPIAELAGGMLSYNRLDIFTSLNVPVVATLLAWQVISRPWEAAAYPVSLIPAQRRPAGPEVVPEPA